MRGTVKWFNAQKGYGFLVMEDGTDIFLHYSGLNMEGFKTIDKDEIVEFEVIETEKGKQAVNVTPIITMKMVEDVLKPKNLLIVINPNACDAKKYAVMDKNEVIQTSEEGMTFSELAAYAGIDVKGLGVSA